MFRVRREEMMSFLSPKQSIRSKYIRQPSVLEHVLACPLERAVFVVAVGETSGKYT